MANSKRLSALIPITMRNFRTYDTWQHGIELVSKVYAMMGNLPTQEMYSLVKQMQRSAVSIPSNFAEGCSRSSEKEFKHFIEVALGSAFELETQLILSDKLFGLSKSQEYDETMSLLSKVQAKLNTLRNRLKGE